MVISTVGTYSVLYKHLNCKWILGHSCLHRILRYAASTASLDVLTKTWWWSWRATRLSACSDLCAVRPSTEAPAAGWGRSINSSTMSSRKNVPRFDFKLQTYTWSSVHLVLTSNIVIWQTAQLTPLGRYFQDRTFTIFD